MSLVSECYFLYHLMIVNRSPILGSPVWFLSQVNVHIFYFMWKKEFWVMMYSSACWIMDVGNKFKRGICRRLPGGVTRKLNLSFRNDPLPPFTGGCQQYQAWHLLAPRSDLAGC